MENKKQIFHPWHLWEDHKHGFYDNISGRDKKEMIEKVISMFSSPELTETYMRKIINEWQYSCEHNLTNMNMNRVAYLGQAACCVFAGVPCSVTMEAWNKVDKDKRDIADSIATKLIKEWEVKNA
jgi:hypothetical protein